MQFKKDTDVFTAGGDKVGEIDRVVLDPRTKEVTHVTVREGVIFTEDKVVPIDLIASATEEHVTLREDAGDLEALPKFKETHFVLLDERNLAEENVPPMPIPRVYPYPPHGPLSTYPVSTVPPYTVETERNIPEETVALEEGAKVISADQEHVGDVEEVLTGPQADRASHLVVSQGLFLKEKKLIPTRWVSMIEKDQVRLAVGSRLLEGLPEYEG